MAYMDHIRRCNDHDLARYRPWWIGDRVAGWFRLDFLEQVARFPEVFDIRDERIMLAPALTGAAERSGALEMVCMQLSAQGVLPPARGELFPVSPTWHMEPLAYLDRRWVGYFGLPAYGVHLNGYVRRPDGLHMWIARRSRHKMTYPGQLDNLVAGGQPIGIGLFENMLKEAAEEAAIPPETAANIRPAGAISYMMDTPEGLKLDTMYTFDLEVPADFEPRNTDGEVESFMLLPVGEVAAIVRDSFDFKFNCSMVIIDFLIRHAWLTPDDEPDYAALCAGLRTPFPMV